MLLERMLAKHGLMPLERSKGDKILGKDDLLVVLSYSIATGTGRLDRSLLPVPLAI
jgi:hypothetical protein